MFLFIRVNLNWYYNILNLISISKVNNSTAFLLAPCSFLSALEGCCPTVTIASVVIVPLGSEVCCFTRSDGPDLHCNCLHASTFSLAVLTTLDYWHFVVDFSYFWEEVRHLYFFLTVFGKQVEGRQVLRFFMSWILIFLSVYFFVLDNFIDSYANFIVSFWGVFGVHWF